MSEGQEPVFAPGVKVSGDKIAPLKLRTPMAQVPVLIVREIFRSSTATTKRVDSFANKMPMGMTL